MKNIGLLYFLTGFFVELILGFIWYLFLPQLEIDSLKGLIGIIIAIPTISYLLIMLLYIIKFLPKYYNNPLNLSYFAKYIFGIFFSFIVLIFGVMAMWGKAASL